MQTKALFQHAVEQAQSQKPRDLQQTYALARELKEICDASTNLYVIDLLGDDPLGFSLDTLVENVDMRGIRSTLGEYVDQEYINRDVVPSLMQAKETGQSNMIRHKAKIQNYYAVYDRLVLPVPEVSTVRWSLSITKTRLLLPIEPSGRDLTERQKDILLLMAQGLSSKEAARKFSISHRTIEHQIASIKSKLNAKNVAHAIAIAVARTLLE